MSDESLSSNNPPDVERDKLQLDKEKFEFEKHKYEAEESRRHQEVAKLAAESEKLAADRLKAQADREELRAAARRSYIQMIIGILGPLALIIAAFITLEKDALLRSKDDVEKQKNELLDQKKDLEKQSKDLSAQTKSLSGQVDILEDRRKKLEDDNLDAQKTLTGLHDQLEASKRDAAASVVIVRVKAYVDQLDTDQERSADSSIFAAIVGELKEDQTGIWQRELQTQAYDSQRRLGLRALLAFGLFRAKGDRSWLEKSEDLCEARPEGVGRVAIGIFEDDMVTDRERERYLRAAYDSLPPMPEFPEPEHIKWGGEIAAIFKSLYNPVVAERFRQPFIDRVRLARDFFYKQDFHAPAARQNVLLSLLCNDCVGGQAKALANICCLANPQPMAMREYAYGGLPVPPPTRFGYLSNLTTTYQNSELEFNNIVRRGAPAELEQFRKRWLADKDNAEMKVYWLEDDRMDFLQHLRKEMFERVEHNIWIYPAQLN